jgi:hypothetical protein
MTASHDARPFPPHSDEMRSEATRMVEVPVTEQHAPTVGPLAWAGLRSLVLIAVSLLMVLVGLPAALAAAAR